MSIDRFELVRASFGKKAPAVDLPDKKSSEYFGERLFNRAVMRKYLDPQTFEALMECIDQGHPLDRAMADRVARGMKEWALENHVTHVTHWFQPLTEGRSGVGLGPVPGLCLAPVARHAEKYSKTPFRRLS